MDHGIPPSRTRDKLEEALALFRQAMYRGPVQHKLAALRRRCPELGYELDDLATALRQMGDCIESLLHEQLAPDTSNSAAPRATTREETAPWAEAAS